MLRWAHLTHPLAMGVLTGLLAGMILARYVAVLLPATLWALVYAALTLWGSGPGDGWQLAYFMLAASGAAAAGLLIWLRRRRT